MPEAQFTTELRNVGGCGTSTSPQATDRAPASATLREPTKREVMQLLQDQPTERQQLATSNNTKGHHKCWCVLALSNRQCCSGSPMSVHQTCQQQHLNSVTYSCQPIFIQCLCTDVTRTAHPHTGFMLTAQRSWPVEAKTAACAVPNERLQHL